MRVEQIKQAIMSEDGPAEVRLGWEVVDFRPDASGWQAIYLQPEPGTGPGWYAVPVVGWLIQKAQPYDARTFRNLDDADDRVPWEEGDPKTHQVVAGVVEDIYIEPADFVDTFWQLVPPGESFSPTAEQIADRRERYHHRQEMRRQQRRG
ncbi:MAG: hypothetical protein ACRD29_23840 [Acidimicrobiales bacterium]